MSANPFAVAARRSLLLFAWQLACILLVALVVAVVGSGRAGGSILAGGGIGLVWTVYLALILLKHSLDFGARVSAASFFKGWLFKIVVTGALLIGAFRVERLEPLAVLGGLFTAMVAYWIWFAFGLDRRWPRASGERG
ncbi:MAG: ATP synthase subunit I [Gammaproteobacteria bacterium]|nr:hypothetical protein [Gammaproteobacteria bacterium]